MLAIRLDTTSVRGVAREASRVETQLEVAMFQCLFAVEMRCWSGVFVDACGDGSAFHVSKFKALMRALRDEVCMLGLDNGEAQRATRREAESARRRPYRRSEEAAPHTSRRAARQRAEMTAYRAAQWSPQ